MRSGESRRQSTAGRALAHLQHEERKVGLPESRPPRLDLPVAGAVEHLGVVCRKTPTISDESARTERPAQKFAEIIGDRGCSLPCWFDSPVCQTTAAARSRWPSGTIIPS